MAVKYRFVFSPSRIAVSLAAAVFLFGGGQTAAAPACPGAYGTAQLTVEPVYGKIGYRTGNTRGDLKRIQEQHAGFGRGLPGRWYPLGLTQAQFEMHLNTNVMIQPLAAGRFCAFPSSVEILIGYPRFTVWVDRRYRRGSCEYRAILDHEHEHIQIYRDKLRYHLDWLHREIAKVIRRLPPVTVSSPQSAADRVQARIQRQIRPLIREMQRLSEHANAEIDSPSSYQSIHDQCRNW